MISTPEGRLARIAEAHCQEDLGHGITSGWCVECGFAHPCPTYIWATSERDLLATWDPRDEEEEQE